MSMTEKEASKRWCPFSRRAANEPRDVTYNRSRGNVIIPRNCHCIGSECIAWRWTEPLIDGPDSYQSEPKPTGYCGLAGPPNMGVMI